MSRMMRNDDVIGGTSNNSRQILYEPSGRAQTNVSNELDKINTDITTINGNLSGKVDTSNYRLSGDVGFMEFFHDTNDTNTNAIIFKVGGTYRFRLVFNGTNATYQVSSDSGVNWSTIWTK